MLEPGHQSRQLPYAAYPSDGAPFKRLDCRPEREKGCIAGSIGADGPPENNGVNLGNTGQAAAGEERQLW